VGGVKMRYIVNDNEGYNFMEWTHDQPLTRKELLEVFKEFADNDGIDTPKKHFSLKFCADLWNVDIIPYKEGLK
jgi:hypothetical protein